MVWRVGISSRKAAKLVMRHRLYIFGTFAWILTGGLALASFQWQPHAQGLTKETPPTVAIAQRQARPKPQVAGAATGSDPLTTTDSTQQSQQDQSALTNRQKPNIILAIIQQPTTITGQPASGGQTVASAPNPDPTPLPVTTPDPLPASPPPAPDPSPTPAPTPTPPPPAPAPTGPTPNPTCTVDPALNFSLLGVSALTVVAGSQTTIQQVTTSDGKSVLWTPLEPVIWADGTSADINAPVAMVLSYNPSTVAGSSASYVVRALSTATPDTVTQITWHVEDGSRGICHNVTIPVTVVAAPPPVVVTAVVTP